jgi:glutamate/tyrosine decarboxylase-like PLP-dependent enzyme
MASDTLMPALLAQMMTLPYNPNNVVDEAAPVTLDMELTAGLQLAKMIGFNADEDTPDCAFGHLTSGGTVANYEAIHLLRAIRHFPMALAMALRTNDSPQTIHTDAGAAITDLDDWTLGNISLDEVIRIRERFLSALKEMPDEDAQQLLDSLEAERIETLGWHGFHERHPDWKPPVLLLPITGHYSWAKGAKLLGLGTRNVEVIAEREMRMDTDALKFRLDELFEARIPVLASVAVLGTTEFGTIDPVHEIVNERDERLELGQYVPIHVDAAWGGYLCALFRDPDGRFLPRENISQDFIRFPSDNVYRAFEALASVDTVTVDPHKLGFVPFGAGAVLFRDHRMLDLVTQDADYLFDSERNTNSYRDKFQTLGKYILEGSKPGAAAAAVCVSQTVVPLDRDNLGKVLAETIHATEYFLERIPQLASELQGIAHVAVPFRPDTNLLCIAINPAGNRSLKKLNQFSRQIFGAMRVDASVPVQSREFFGSYTTLTERGLGETDFSRCLALLGIEEDDDDHRIFILRHTLMNPWLIDSYNGINYIDQYCVFLRGIIEDVLT